MIAILLNVTMAVSQSQESKGECGLFIRYNSALGRTFPYIEIQMVMRILVLCYPQAHKLNFLSENKRKRKQIQKQKQKSKKKSEYKTDANKKFTSAHFGVLL